MKTRPTDPRRAPMAPPLSVSQWFNTDRDLDLPSLRGRVVVLHTFQMLCPGCVSHGLPQAQKLHALFPKEDVAVVGLHTVFEHHEAMTAVSLEAFLYEYRIRFPVGIDLPGKSSPIPTTMERYALRGTPSLVVIDRIGRLRVSHFGRIDDMAVGALVASMVADTVANDPNDEPLADGDNCDDDVCEAPP